jgi:ParB family chromosome partitioning protein
MNFESDKILRVKLSHIRPNPNQPRTEFDDEFIKELATGIKSNGVTEPLLLKRLDPPVGVIAFEIIKGEQRWRASKLAGETEVPALVGKVANPLEQFEIAFVSDVLRKRLSDPDIARGLKKFVDEGLSHKKIGEKVGQSTSWVWQRLKLLKLPPQVLKQMGPQIPEDKRLSFSNAIRLCGEVSDRPTQVALARKIAGKVTTREAKQTIQKTALAENLSTRAAKARRTEDFRIFHGHLERVSTDLEQRVKNTSSTDFISLLEGGNPEEIDGLIGFLAKIANSADTLKTAVKKFAKEHNKKK